MKMDLVKIPFANVATGGTLAEFDVGDAYQVAVAVDIDSVAGAFGTATMFVIPLDEAGAELGSSAEHVRQSNAAGAVGVFLLGKKGSAEAEVAFENAYRKIRVKATLATLTSVTGSVYIFLKRF
jgi:hypothetical protein